MTQQDEQEQARDAGQGNAGETAPAPKSRPGMTRLRTVGLSALTIAGGALISEPIGVFISSYYSDVKAERAERQLQENLEKQREIEAERRAAEARRLAEERARTEKLVEVSEKTARILEELTRKQQDAGTLATAPQRPATPPATPPPPATLPEITKRAEPEPRPAPLAPAAAPDPKEPRQAPEERAKTPEKAEPVQVALVPPRLDLAGKNAPPPESEPPRRAPPQAATPDPVSRSAPGAAAARSFSVLPGTTFRLCGHTSFTAELSSLGVLLVNTDRSFEHRTGFRQWEKRVQAGRPAEVFPGCTASFEQQVQYGARSLLVREFPANAGD